MTTTTTKTTTIVVVVDTTDLGNVDDGEVVSLLGDVDVDRTGALGEDVVNVILRARPSLGGAEDVETTVAVLKVQTRAGHSRDLLLGGSVLYDASWRFIVCFFFFWGRGGVRGETKEKRG